MGLRRLRRQRLEFHSPARRSRTDCERQGLGAGSGHRGRRHGHGGRRLCRTSRRPGRRRCARHRGNRCRGREHTAGEVPARAVRESVHGSRCPARIRESGGACHRKEGGAAKRRAAEKRPRRVAAVEGSPRQHRGHRAARGRAVRAARHVDIRRRPGTQRNRPRGYPRAGGRRRDNRIRTGDGNEPQPIDGTLRRGCRSGGAIRRGAVVSR